MEYDQTNYLGTPQFEIGRETFLRAVWADVAIGAAFTILRLANRLVTFRRIWMDDAFIILAFLCTLAIGITWHFITDYMYNAIEALNDESLQTQARQAETRIFLRAHLGPMLLFFTGIWSVKLSFLAFFKRLGRNVRGQNWIWWPVFIITIATYVASIAHIDYRCFVGVDKLCYNPASSARNRVFLILTCVWDVTTDFLIMAIPFKLLWGTNINWKRKLALGGIFSLTMVTVIVAIVRTALSIESNIRDPPKLKLWYSIELTVALVVGCLASFKGLFARHDLKLRLHPFPHHGGEISFGSEEDRQKAKAAMNSLVGVPVSVTQIKSEGRDPENTPVDVSSDSEMSKLERVHVRYSLRQYDERIEFPSSGSGSGATGEMSDPTSSQQTV